MSDIWNGKPGTWYVRLFDYEYDMLWSMLVSDGVDPLTYLSDFVQGTDGNWYAELSEIDEQESGAILGSPFFSDAPELPKTFVNLSLQPSLFP